MDATNIALCDMYIEGAKDLDRNQAGKLAFGIVIDLVKDANRTLEDVRRVKSTFLAPERQALIGTPTLEYCKKVCDYLEKLFPRVANRAGPIPTLSCGNAHRS